MLFTGVYPATKAPQKRYVTNLSKSLRVLVIGDSQSAGRGTGTGSVSMDGARALSWPSKMCDYIRANGFKASSESMFEANNTGGTWNLYDPRVNSESWIYGSNTIGGRLLYSNTSGLGIPSWTPGTNVDTFEIYTPDNAFGALNASINGVSQGTIYQNTGSNTFKKTVLTSTLGINTLRLARNSTIGNSAYISGIVAYDSTVNEFRIINIAARGWSTVEWTDSAFPWRPFPGIETLSADIAIICLGTNDRRVGGAGLNVATFKTNMQQIINKARITASKVILVMPMPIEPASVSTISDAELLSAYQELSSTNNAPLVRTDTILGSWTAANAAGLTSDNLHWKANASLLVAKEVANVVTSDFILGSLPWYKKDYAAIANDGTTVYPSYIADFEHKRYAKSLYNGNLSESSLSGITETTSRASSATYFDGSGNLQTAYGTRTNYVLYSEDPTVWNNTATNITSVSGKYKISATTTSSNHFRRIAGNISSNTLYTISCTLEPAEHTWTQLLFTSATFGTTAWANFNLSGVGSVGTTGTTGLNPTITYLGNNQYRISISAVSSASGTDAGIICMTNNTNSDRAITYSGDNTSGFYIINAQLETNPVATPYIKTTTVPVSVSGNVRFTHDMTSLQPLGVLIEESRTNYIPNNTMIGLATPSTAPTGWSFTSISGISATLSNVVYEKGIPCFDVTISGTATSTGDVVLDPISINSVSASSGQKWCHSAYLKLLSGTIPPQSYIGFSGRTSAGAITESFTSLLTSVGVNSTFKRYSTTGTLSSATTSYIRPQIRLSVVSGTTYSCSIRIGAPQLESTNMSSSILTYGNIVTRSQDECYTSDMSFFNGNEGTFIVNSFVLDAGNHLGFGTSSPNIRGNLWQTSSQVGAFYQGSLASSNPASSISSTVGSPIKIGTTYSSLPYQGLWSAGIGRVGLTTNIGFPWSITRLSMGCRYVPSASNYGNMPIKTVLYYPKRLLASEVQRLTT